MLKKFHGLSRQAQLILMIISGTLLLAFILVMTKPSVGKEEIEDPRTLVEVIVAKQGNERVTVSAFGTVEANRTLNIHPEVSGKIVETSDNFTKGGLLSTGEVILKIDPRNYQIAVDQEKAAVEKAEFELQVERGKQIVAEREWQLLTPSIDIKTEIGEELALRRPHLREKKAALAAAMSRLSKAELDLERTSITSPFNAIVIDESVERGEYITPQSNVATLVDADRFRIQVSIPLGQLSWVRFPSGREQGSEVEIIQDFGGGQTFARKGRLLRLLSDIDPASRMARVLVAVDDPLGTTPPLLIGTYVRVEIKGPTLRDVFVIPREALHEGDKLWIKGANDTLEIRKVNTVLRREKSIVIDEGLADGEHIIMTNIPLAIPGTELFTPAVNP